MHHGCHAKQSLPWDRAPMPWDPLHGPCGHPPQGSPSRRWVPKLPKVNDLLVPDLAAMVGLETGN